MQYITEINRERNKKIISQSKKINRLLIDNKIRPIFLKGIGNLIAGLYNDIAERMIGDIDFIFSKEDYPKAISILRDDGYINVWNIGYHVPIFMHYTRLKKEKEISAIEIHKELVKEKYSDEFNYSFVQKDSLLINGFKVLSYANKLNLSIIADQINDERFYYKTICLRNAYDVFLLSKKTNSKEALKNLNKLKHPLNCFLSTSFEFFNKVDSLKYYKTTKAESYLKVFNSQFTNTNMTKRRFNRIKIYLFIKSRLNDIFKAIIYKEYRVWLFNRITDKNWYKEKLIQLGVKQEP